ncbi:MAG: apolipoprotein N-acyltransferase, partial [Candidatus Omnitrophica bacterium]|nr:apolipoprotein N-acyltransferase [Candidatus Omnitrophota bacterium]
PVLAAVERNISVVAEEMSEFITRYTLHATRKIKNKGIDCRAILLSLFSSLLLILSFPKFNLSFLAWIGFVPLFIGCKGKSRKHCFFLFYLAGAVFWAGILYWLIQVNFIGFFLLVLYLAIYFGIFGLAIGYTLHATRYTPKIANQRSIIFYFLFVPSLWVVLEFIRSHLFSGFAWALLGYSQYLNLPIIQIADISGAYGVSFLIMMVNGVLGLQATGYRLQAKKRVLLALLPVLCIIGTLIYGYIKIGSPVTSHQSPVTISVVQGNIPQKQKWDEQFKENILNKYINLSQEAARKDSPDLIIWPETAVPAYFNQDKGLKDRILEFSSHIDTFLLIGTPLLRGNKSFNSAVLISSDKTVQQYDKLHLVPFGEYVPSLFSFIRRFIEIGDFSPGKDWTVFQSHQSPGHQLPGHQSPVPAFAVLICFEDVFPYLSRGFVKRGADFLINISNDAWFGKSSAPYQHCQSAVFRAVENRVQVIKCSNTGISCFIKPSGEIFGRLLKQGKDIFVDGYSTQRILIEKKQPSFYTRFGDIFALLCLLFCVGFSIIQWVIGFRLKKSKRI